MLGNTFFVQNTVCLVIDEVHKVTWGVASKGNKPFRESFGRINELRSICRINLPVLALTATVDLDITALIQECCNLSPSVSIISESVERKNVSLHVFKLETKSVIYFDWLLKMLTVKGAETPKTLIFAGLLAI